MTIRSLFYLTVATSVFGPLHAQTISISTEKASALYQSGETIRWQVTVTEPEKLASPKFTVKSGGLNETDSGTLALTDGKATIQKAASAPGWFLLEVNGTNAAGTPVRAYGGALVDPGAITPGADRPADFDSFWQSKLDALATVPLNAVVTPGASDRSGVDYATVSLDCLNGTHVQGQLARPSSGTKFPALLIVQWAGVYSLQKSWATGRATEGWLVLNTQAHDIAPVADDAYYTGLSDGALKDYPRQGNEDRETSYFLRMYLACHRAAEYLTTRPDWNGETLVVMGASQGGLQALVTAALHPGVTAVLADVPAGSDQGGLDAGRVPGWPVWAWQAWDRDLAKVKNTSRYYDVTNFMGRITCPVLMGTGLIDTTVPPVGVYASYNLLTGARQIVPMPLGDHINGHSAYNTEQEAWLRDARTARQPTLSTQPRSISVGTGEPAVLSASATNGRAFGYQWYRNGTAIPGATADQLKVPSVTETTSGDYTVEVTSPGGKVTSSIAHLSVAAAAAPSYSWDNVVIRGGGFVSGVLFHPTTRNLIYARTDVGGVYRWEQNSSTWTPLNDDLGMGDAQLTGVLSFAVDPADDQRLYLACGQYLQSWARTAAILRSTDRGATWTRTELPIKLGGNADGRGTGERLQVDPNQPSVLLLGTNQNGLWRSTDSGVSWSQLTAFAPTGVTFVLFDSRSASAGNASQVIYAGVDSGTATLYRTTDGGFTWAPVAGAPARLIPTHADIDSNGMLYLSYADTVGPNNMTAGAVWKYDTGTAAWTNISPRTPTGTDPFGWGAVSVGKTAPGVLVATTNCRWGSGDEIWRSTDAGATWTNVNPLDTYDADTTPWVLFHGTAAGFRPHWLADVDLDPFDANRVLFVTGSGIWGTDNAFGAAPVWTFRNDGLEETVPLEVACPPSGTLLLSALGDIGGFRHDSLDSSQPEANFFNPINATNTGLDFAQGAPANVVRTNYGATRGNYSTNYGTTWAAFATCPATATANGPGKIAINTNGTRIVWNPDDSAAYYSTDSGSSWTLCAGAPRGSFTPVADRVNANKFYLYDSDAGRVYVSLNGGQTFTAAAAVPAHGAPMRAPFGLEGNLWLPAWTGGLYRSTNSGTSFTAVSSVQEAYRVGFGQAAAGQPHPAVFLWGKVGGVVGLHRSDDAGTTWTRINDNAHQFGWINAITGDPQLHGRIYIATGGRGIIYGTSSESLSAPSISITSPSSGTSYTAGITVGVDATAADTDGSVASVAFYRGSTLIGSDTTSPYSVSWTSTSAGTYSLTAVATDNDGLTTTSAAVNITINAAPTAPSTPTTPTAPSGGGGGALSGWYVVMIVVLGGARLRPPRR